MGCVFFWGGGVVFSSRRKYFFVCLKSSYVFCFGCSVAPIYLSSFWAQVNISFVTGRKWERCTLSVHTDTVSAPRWSSAIGRAVSLSDDTPAQAVSMSQDRVVAFTVISMHFAVWSGLTPGCLPSGCGGHQDPRELLEKVSVHTPRATPPE